MDISTIIHELVEKYGTSDPFRLCEFLDITVVKHPLGNETRGLIKSYKRNHIICINNELSEIQQLITCAHELGHYKLHRKVNTLLLKTCTFIGVDRYELEADKFAESLLAILFEC